MGKKNKSAVKPPPPPSSSEDDSSEDETKKQVVQKQKAVKKAPIESSEDSSSDDEQLPPQKLAKKSKSPKTAAPKVAAPETSSDDSDDEEVAPAKQQKVQQKVADPAESSDSDEEMPPAKTAPIQSTKVAKKKAESSSDDDSEEETVKKPTVANGGTRSASPVKASHFVLCGNLDDPINTNELKNFLTNKGVPVLSANVLPQPLVLIGLHSQKDAEALLAKCQNSPYKNKSLTLCQLSGRPGQLLATGTSVVGGNVSNTSLFISNIAMEVDESALRNMIQNKLDEPTDLVSLKMLTKKGASAGQHRGQAIAEFTTAESTEQAMQELNQMEFGGRQFKVTFYVQRVTKDDTTDNKKAAFSKSPGTGNTARPGRPTSSELRGQTRTLMLNGLASNCDYKQIKVDYPGGIRYDKNRSNESMCFIEFETEDQCSEAYDSFQSVNEDVTITLVQQRKSNNNQQSGKFNNSRGGSGDEPAPSTTLGVFNLSFNTTVDTLKEMIPTANDMFIPQSDGRSRGFAIVMFDSIDAATDVLNELNGSDIDGRTVRVSFREDRPSGGGRGGGRGGRGGRGGGDRGGRGGGFRGGRGRGDGKRPFDGGRGGFNKKPRVDITTSVKSQKLDSDSD